MEEYICETQSVIAWQHRLNAWARDYTIEILAMTQYQHEERVTILLKRTKIQRWNERAAGNNGTTAQKDDFQEEEYNLQGL